VQYNSFFDRKKERVERERESFIMLTRGHAQGLQIWPNLPKFIEIQRDRSGLRLEIGDF
jgi:hypothetical protein